jgi:hypothetical protein
MTNEEEKVETYEGSIRRGKAVFHVHTGDDWCHLCGEKAVDRLLADIWFPRIAEHDKPVKHPPGPCYTRICSRCLHVGAEFLGNEDVPAAGQIKKEKQEDKNDPK